MDMLAKALVLAVRYIDQRSSSYTEDNDVQALEEIADLPGHRGMRSEPPAPWPSGQPAVALSCVRALRQGSSIGTSRW